MKIRAILAAAGMVIAAMGVSTGADAQPRDGYHGQGRHDDGGRRGFGNRRGHDRHGYHRPVRRCHTEYRHHRRIRVCR